MTSFSENSKGLLYENLTLVRCLKLGSSRLRHPKSVVALENVDLCAEKCCQERFICAAILESVKGQAKYSCCFGRAIMVVLEKLLEWISYFKLPISKFSPKRFRLYWVQ